MKNLIDDILKFLNEEELAKSQDAKQNADVTRMLDIDVKDKKESNKDEIFELRDFIVNPSFNTKLRKLHDTYQGVWQKKTEYNALLKGFFVGDLGAKTFTLKERQNGEYALHVTGTASSLKKIDELISKSTEYHGSCFHILQNQAKHDG